MQCELCGKEGFVCRPGIVDGVKMMLCSNCIRHGEVIKITTESSSSVKSSVIDRIKKPIVKDVYKDMNKELVSGWNDLIKNARQKKGLSREELGFKIGERTVTISKIENGDLRPSDKTITKLEKELDITLFEIVKSISKISGVSQTDSSLTLGDFIKNEDK
jgi:putative transcription factor